MINGKNVFDKPVKTELRTSDNIQKFEIYFSNYYNLIAIDLSNQQ